ncbi:FUSC family protein [Flavipsychrobacter stenotrophus]|nr:FUSC family protein [Flavipsychrobacter stenotrophus]
MALINSYKRFNAFIQNESFEPMVSWGIRMAISGTVPLIWGLATNHVSDAVWIALTAEAISWVEMKGSFNWRVRTLFIGALLALFWGALGTLTGDSIVLSVLFMFVAAFVATLLKNLGDRASGLAICVYLMYIICNAYPDRDTPDVKHRILTIAIGTAWPIIVGISASLLMPVQQPFRRQIALIWRSISVLVDTITRSAVDPKARHDIYLKEKEVRTAIDHSFEFYGRMAHQGSATKDNRQYQLLLLRKNAALVAVNVIAIADEMEHIAIQTLDEALRVKAATLFSALEEAVSRISVFVLTLKAEEKLLAISQINRLKKLTALIKAYPLEEGHKQTIAINRILQLTGRTVKLLESAVQRVELMGDDVPVFKSYSLVKTMFVLQPRKIAGNIKTLAHVNTLAFRFALRSAIAASIAMLIFKFFKIDHGYWIPFSLMIVIQPYFGATLKKAVDRVFGTLLGGIVGSLLLLLPTGIYLKESVMFVTFVLMVYYVRKNYAIAVFVVTVNLVLLFNIDHSYSNQILIYRGLCTIGGSLLAVVSGFALLPAWDEKWLPTHLASAVKANYDYFTGTFFSKVNNWTKNKRVAESKNSDVFDSFNRYMEEPGKEKTEAYYDIITCNVRITRDLNTINIEQEEKKTINSQPDAAQQAILNECLQLFHDILPSLHELNHHVDNNPIVVDGNTPPPFRLNEVQIVSLEKLRIELKALKADLLNLTI